MSASLAAAVLGGMTGCTDSGQRTYASEADEPAYREAQSLQKAGRRREALQAYLKVIERRGDDAPESHLEAGLLYQQYFRDPLAAIFHYQRFLAARLNSPQAPMVKQRIDSAKREFAQTLPARPIEEQAQRVDLIAALDKLKLENDQLKQQLADLQAGRGTGPLPVVDAGREDLPSIATEAAEAGFTLSLDRRVPTVSTGASRSNRPAPATPAASAPAVARPAGVLPQVGQAQAARSARAHTVQKGDTLSSLSQRYYGNRTRWRDIYQANRSVMKSETDLKVGAQLVIPP